MKKFTKSLFLAVTLIAAGTMSFAQRSTNLALTLTSPANGSSLLPNVKVPLTVSVKNNGTAALNVGDTLFFITSLSTTAVKLKVLTAAMPNGQTQSITLDTLTNNGTGTADQTISFCTTVINPAQFGVTINGVPVAVTYNDPDTTNNSGCNSIIIKKGGTDILEFNSGSEVRLSVYPNPASGEVTLNYAADKAEHVTVSVKDITGREVSGKDFGTIKAGISNPLKINVGNLNSGLYIVELTAGAKRAVGKVTVKH
jgi:hypothetical protein